jgi:hypothetical protein
MADFVTETGPQQFEAGIGFVGNNPVFGGRDALTASTTHSIAGGTPIDRNICRFSVVANAGDAATLPFGFPGLAITVVNAGANTMQVYAAQSADTLNGLAGSTGIPIMAGGCVNFYCANIKAGATIWTAQDVGVGNSGAFPLIAYQTGLVAGTTQTAAGGTAITTSMAEFDTVAHTGDAATLPPAQAGMQINVINNGANTLGVFAATAALGGIGGGDTINGSTAVFNMASPPLVTIFFCTVQGKWLTK